ncbi:alpha-taxilin isoform X2 [Aplysia californica]|nr:alpha-taxilin isoform X2 [Aplysia californica]
MSTGDSTVETQPPPTEAMNGIGTLDTGSDLLEQAAKECLDNQDTLAADLLEDVDSEEDEDGDTDEGNLEAAVAPTNTPVNGDSGQASPVMQSSSDSLSDDAQKQQKVAATAPAGKTVLTMAPGAAAKSMADTKGKMSARESKKEEKKKNKKKEDKSIEYILRALNSLQSPEEKLAALCKKYADLHEEHRVLQTSFKTQQRTMAVVMREKDQLQSEHTKAMMAKSKLESLCRELQKQNKIIKDESIKRAREEDERRKEISAQFQTTIGEIQTQMSDNTERNSKLRQENGELATQLQNIIKQCDARETQIDKVRKQHDLEQQLAEAKLSKAELQLKEERERNAREKELLVQKFTEQAKKNSMLEAQVEMFKERYDDFERLHSRSSETFQKYKTEMDKMTKRIKKLEKDGIQWKAKWEASNKALLEMVDARNKSEKETITYVQKCKKLESLCRALQGELHGKKPASETSGDLEANTDHVRTEDDAPPSSTAPPNSPDSSSTEQCCSDPNLPCSIAESAAEPSPQISSTKACPGDVPATSSPVVPSPSSSPSSTTATPSTSSNSNPEVGNGATNAASGSVESGAATGATAETPSGGESMCSDKSSDVSNTQPKDPAETAAC